MFENTLMETLGMELVEANGDRVVMTMPVDHRTVQPFGYLHGGASVALAETVASIGANVSLEVDKYAAFGLEINANHVRSVREGVVTATGTPIHKGRSTQIWEVRITGAEGELVCISRCTMSIIPKK